MLRYIERLNALRTPRRGAEIAAEEGQIRRPCGGRGKLCTQPARKVDKKAGPVLMGSVRPGMPPEVAPRPVDRQGVGIVGR